MQFISADTIYTIHTAPLENTVIVLNEAQEVLDLIPQDLVDPLNINRYEGLICPGFVNTHCHLELSYMKNKIAGGQGLHAFIKGVEFLKKPSDETVLQAIQEADEEMYQKGIVAVGDISNTPHSFFCKSQSKIYYHHFLEIYAFDETRADLAFSRGLQLQKELLGYLQENIFLQSSITPHAPYSASVKLLQLFSEHARKHQSILSIHNQESADENLFFMEKKGSILNRMHDFNIPLSHWQAPGKSSLQATLPHLPDTSPLLLVHNTFSNREDVLFALAHHPKLFWCFCVNANLYIENTLPDIALFRNLNCQISLGTDSYASNWSLSIFDEIKTLASRFPDLPKEEILRWATLNGARFLGIDKRYGSIEKGKRPGLNLISTDFTHVIPLI